MELGIGSSGAVTAGLGIGAVAAMGPGIYEGFSASGMTLLSRNYAYETAQVVYFAVSALVACSLAPFLVYSFPKQRQYLVCGALTYPLLMAGWLLRAKQHVDWLMYFGAAVAGLGGPVATIYLILVRLQLFSKVLTVKYLTDGLGDSHHGIALSAFWGAKCLGSLVTSLIQQCLPKQADTTWSVGSITVRILASYTGLAFGYALLSWQSKQIESQAEKTVPKPCRGAYLPQSLRHCLLRLVWLLPAAFSSQFAYPFAFNVLNSLLVQGRASAIVNTCQWTGQVAAAGVVYAICMTIREKRRLAWTLVSVALVLCMVVYGLTVLALRGQCRGCGTIYDTATTSNHEYLLRISWLQFGYGAVFATHNLVLYLLLFQQIDESDRYTAISVCQGLQASGAAISWRLDSLNMQLFKYHATCWALAASAIIMLYGALSPALEVPTEAENDKQVSAAP